MSRGRKPFYAFVSDRGSYLKVVLFDNDSPEGEKVRFTIKQVIRLQPHDTYEPGGVVIVGHHPLSNWTLTPWFAHKKLGSATNSGP